MCAHDADWLSTLASDETDARQIGSIIGSLPVLQALRATIDSVNFANFRRVSRHPQPSSAPVLRRGIG